MPEERKTKLRSNRIDKLYTRRTGPLRSFRVLLIVLGMGAALVWWGASVFARRDGSGGGGGLNLAMYNPGPVAAPHAMFGNNCATCHDGRDGGLFKTVSDRACLECHSAATHGEHPVDPKADVHQLVSLDAGGAAVRSANCVACHVEHKGHEALKGTGDNLCTQCHENLSAHPLAGGAKSELPNRVVAFNLGDHPAFGRALPRGAAGPVDPTNLEYNHKLHVDRHPKEGGGASEMQDCSRCHAMTERPAAKDAQYPPFATPAEAGRGTGRATGAMRYMEPVSYERHCAKCHKLDLPGGSQAITPAFVGAEFEHGTMRSLRSDIARVILAAPRQAEYEQIPIKPKEPEKGGAAAAAWGDALGLSATAGDVDDDDDAPAGLAPRVCLPKNTNKPPAAVKIDRETYLQENSKYLIGMAKKGAKSRLDGQQTKTRGAELAAAQVEAIAARVEAGKTEESLAAAVELYAVYGAANACAKCHTMTSPLAPAPQGVTAAAATATPTAAPTAVAPAAVPLTSDAMKVEIEPTGMPKQPRRWFAHSTFDHQAHRSLVCAECHGDLTKSARTEELHMPLIGQCIDCHQSGGGGGATSHAVASSSCVTCHDYHDRSKPSAPAVRMTAREVMRKAGRNPG